MTEIAYDRYSMILDGRREFIRSGAMHYFRLPSVEMWRDRLYKLKAAGYNCVDLYFCWDYHSPAQGVYDFSGIRDIRKLLDITKELGLYVLGRPGPYINAEYSGGGFPGWLLAKKELPLRNRREGAFVWSDEYMGYVREWWEQIIPIIKDYDNILMVQIENEYATLEMEEEYMRALYAMTREYGVTVPLFHNDLYVAGLYSDIIDIYSFDNYSVTQFEKDWREMPEIFQVLDGIEASLRPFCENRPLFAAELQAGWYGAWNGWSYDTIHEYLGREHIGISTRSVIGQGLTVFNHYKAIGGTNWGFTGSTETYTSYDFGAPISESGVNTERLFEAKTLNNMIASFDIAATDRREDYPFTISDPESLYAVRSLHDNLYAFWIFLRNLTYDKRKQAIDNCFEVEIFPFETMILPYQMPLQSGYRLDAITSEVLHQNERCLYIKANRAITGLISSTDKLMTVNVENKSAGIEIAEDQHQKVVFKCHALKADDFRRFEVGEQVIFLLGGDLADRLWVEEDGTVVMGADERLLDGTYGFAAGFTRAVVVAPNGDFDTLTVPDHAATLEIPKFSKWEMYNEAIELFDPNRVADEFQPISRDGLDFDYNRVFEGSGWYRMKLDQLPKQIEIDARHFWSVFLNERVIGHGHQLVLIHGIEFPPPKTFDVPADAWNENGENYLQVFVTGMGHPKGFHDDSQTPEGLLSLKLDDVPLGKQLSLAANVFSKRPVRAQDTERLLPLDVASPVVRMKTDFVLPEQPDLDSPWGLDLTGIGIERVNIYVNGSLVGRYWQESERQNTFYLPGGLLKPEGETNTLELLLMNFEPYIDQPRLDALVGKISLKPYGVFTKWNRP